LPFSIPRITRRVWPPFWKSANRSSRRAEQAPEHFAGKNKQDRRKNSFQRCNW
jgi:hypothetical protein